MPHEPNAAQVNLGQSIFKTQWAPAGTPNAEHAGVGPLFNAPSCDTCHHDGQRGMGPAGSGAAPAALVVQLETPSADASAEPRGDPVYGRIFNTTGVRGTQPEGVVEIRYSELTGYYYPYGGRWYMRVPHYRLTALSHGPLAPTTVIKPRLAPALFGVGLLEAVPESAITAVVPASYAGAAEGVVAWHTEADGRVLGRFGWQGAALSIRDQTVNAFAREMGLTSSGHPYDDCTAAESECALVGGAAPEVADDLVDAVVSFVRTLMPPESVAPAPQDALGSSLFAEIGCATCHRPQLPVERLQADGTTVAGVIAPYTDLRLHDLGVQMADTDVAGKSVVSRWRSAPLWGLSYRLKMEAHPTFLHDGRARSVEEAILWHGGEAAHATYRFMQLGPRAREALLQWVQSR